MNIVNALSGVTTLAVDTAPFIYFLENDPNYFTITETVFREAQAKSIDITTSTLTLTEILVKPIKAKNKELQSIYQTALINTQNIQLLSATPTIAIRAAELRAQYNLKTPDALHVATALISGAEAFLTNDQGIKRVKEIKIIVLSDLVI